MQIIPGIHQFSFMYDKKFSPNLYVLDGPEASIMVDTGLNEPGVGPSSCT